MERNGEANARQVEPVEKPDLLPGVRSALLKRLAEAELVGRPLTVSARSRCNCPPAVFLEPPEPKPATTIAKRSIRAGPVPPSVPRLEANPEATGAEWLGEFRSDVTGFVDRAVVEAAVVPERFEPPPIATRYLAFCDPSGGGADSFTLAVAHRCSHRWNTAAGRAASARSRG